jgi:hypothetical protein
MAEIQAMQSVIASGQPLTQAAVRDAVAHISYIGIDGRVSFNQDGGNAGTLGFSIYQNNTFIGNFPSQ